MNLRRFYWKLWLGSLLIYLAFLAPGIYSIDGNSMLAVAESVVLRHSVAVEPGLGVAGLHGRYYSLWYPLLSALAVPFVAVGAAAARLFHLPVHYCAAILALVLQSLIVATTVAAVGALAIALGADVSGARFAAIVFGFGTVAPAYARTFFADPLLALLTVLAVLLAIAAKPGSTGGAAALAVLAKPPGVFVGAVLSLYSRVRDKGWRWVLPAAGAAAGVAIFCLYNLVRFGKFMLIHAHPGNATFRLSAFPEGITGLLFSPGFGLVWYCPVVVVAATAGLAAGMKKRPRETKAILLICLAYLGIYALWTTWRGGWAWGPRYLLPVLAILAPFLGLVHGRWRKTALALAVVGFLVSAPTWVCFYERAFAEQSARNVQMETMAWSVSESPLVRVWPAALHELQDAARTNPRELIREVKKPHSPSHNVEESRALRVVAVWWWLLPAVRVPRWIGAVLSLGLVLAGLWFLRGTNPPAPV